MNTEINDMNEVVQQMEKIRSAFMDTQLFCANNEDINSMVEYLEKGEKEFRSIAFESASMAIALNDLETNQHLNNWFLYAKMPVVMPHKAQVHVGLGWAIAKSGIPFLQVVEKIEPGLYPRVADGCGYYDGTFKQRQYILSQQIPGYLPGTIMPMYDQGLGRSLWYSSNAAIDKLQSKIESFPKSRQADLWRGAGIAVAYVGGCDDDTLRTLLESAGTNHIQLAYGAALAARSRMDANTMTKDTDSCSRLWFTLINDKEQPVTFEKRYADWITQIEDGFLINNIQ